MLSESGSLFYRPKQKKLEADTARLNFVKPGGDHFTLLNVWEQWSESGFSISWTYEHFIQIKVRLVALSATALADSLQSLTRVRDIRDQLVQLCERVEIFVEGNPNGGDILPIQKAISAGCVSRTPRWPVLTSAQVLPECRTTESKRRRLPHHQVRAPLDCALPLISCRTNQSVNIHPSSSMFQHQPPPKMIIWFELVMTSREYARQVMEIKPEWLLEGATLRSSLLADPLVLVAPHFFKPADLDALSGVKKGHVKQVGARAEGSR